MISEVSETTTAAAAQAESMRETHGWLKRKWLPAINRRAYRLVCIASAIRYTRRALARPEIDVEKLARALIEVAREMENGRAEVVKHDN
jgi:hypothetical protein